MKTTLTNNDLNYMRTLGRYVARDHDQEALRKAVEYLLIAEEQEVRSLMFWFEEGVRNYAADMWAYNNCMTALQTRYDNSLERRSND